MSSVLLVSWDTLTMNNWTAPQAQVAVRTFVIGRSAIIGEALKGEIGSQSLIVGHD